MSTFFDLGPADNLSQRDGDLRRDRALQLLRVHRPYLFRRLQRTFVQHLLATDADTSDALRRLVAIPPGIDPRIVGSAVRSLAELRLTISIGRRKSCRGLAHSRMVELWAIRDEAAARAWLRDHPDLDPPDDTAGAPAPVIRPVPSGSARAAVI